MNTSTQIETQEMNLQERAAEARADNSLPATQVIEAQGSEAEQNSAPRFIP